MKELRLFLRKIDQKVISKGKHYLLTLIILYRYKTNEVLDHYKEQTPQRKNLSAQHLQYGCAGGKEKRRCPT